MLRYQECKYQLTDHFIIATKVFPPWFIQFGRITLTEEGILGISEGWAWDGPSGPTFDTDDSMVAAVVHDALYELIAEGQLPVEFREKADLELYRQLVGHGMPEFRAWAWYKAVRIAGECQRTPYKFIKCQDMFS